MTQALGEVKKTAVLQVHINFLASDSFVLQSIVAGL